MDKVKKTANFDFLTGAIAIVLGIIYGILAYTLKRSPMGNPMSPSIFPLILAAAMVIFGIILILKSNLEMTKAAFRNIKSSTTANDILSRKMILMTVIASVVYALIFNKLGYVLSTFLFMMVVLTFTNGKKWVKNAIVAAIFSVVVYYIFFYLLHISLPMTPFINM